MPEITSSKTSHEKIIDKNIYTFNIIVLKTSFFNDKKETILKIIDNININKKIANKDNVKILVSAIRADVNSPLNCYKMFDNFKTVNQHYVKNQIQKNWENTNIALLKRTNDTDITLIKKSLTLHDSISEQHKKNFEPIKSYVKENTFDVYEDGYFLYLEDGIVTILENFFENIINKYNVSNIVSINNPKEKKIIQNFFVPYLENRIDKYKHFSNYIKNNHDKDFRVISSYLEKINTIDKHYIVYNLEHNTFNLTSDWVQVLFISDIYEECARTLSQSYLMPYSPKKALFILDDIPFSYLKIKSFNKKDYYFNSILNMIDSFENNDDENILISNEYYNQASLIRFADKQNIKQIKKTFKNGNSIYNIKDLSHEIVLSWKKRHNI